MRRPKVERGALFRFVSATIIDRRHATDDATLMIETRLDYVPLGAQRRHAGRGRSSQIVNCPGRQFIWGALI